MRFGCVINKVLNIKEKNKVSVIVPNYNHERFLDTRISSVMKQSHQEFECLIFDDASTDLSEEIIMKFKASNERILVYPRTLNSGSTFIQWNNGVQIASEKLVWIAESDDNATPDFLAELIKPFNSNSDIVLAYCQSYRMNDKGEVTGNWKDFTDDLDKELFESDFVMDGKEYIERFLIHRNTIPNASAVLFRKSIFQKVGGAPVNLKTNGDWLTWLKMLCYGKVAFVAQPMNYFRYHEDSVIAKAGKNKNSDQFHQQYDYSMRKEFKSFLKKEQLALSDKAYQANEYFIALDNGNEGLFKLRQGLTLQGWKQIIGASIYPKLQTGFIKKGILRK